MTKEIERASRRYADFHGYEATRVDKVEIPAVAFELGRVVGISYEVIDEKGETVLYHHDFDTPPGLAISSDGAIAIILAGEWSFTKRGFVG